MSKGSGRRKEDTEKVRANWDAIFGNRLEKALKAQREALEKAGWVEIKPCAHPFCSCEKKCEEVKE